MWDRAVDGRILRFHLVGINNQNFLMADEETGSWWQQITGECILGALKGKRLRRIASDEVSLAIWRAERPASDAVKFDPRYLPQYPASDWERHVAQVRAPGAAGDPIGPRELVIGIELDGAAVAYSLAALREKSPVNSQIGRRPVVLVVSADRNSVRCFLRPLVNGQALEFFRSGETLIDSTTGSTWTFAGKATAGPLAGQSLDAVQVTKDFWFDWRRYHPAGALRWRGL